MSEISGVFSLFRPLWKTLSFNIVRSVLSIEEFALKISSKKTILLEGIYPSVFLSNLSFWSCFIDKGPNISSGVVNFVKRYSK